MHDIAVRWEADYAELKMLLTPLRLQLKISFRKIVSSGDGEEVAE